MSAGRRLLTSATRIASPIRLAVPARRPRCPDTAMRA